MEFRQTETLCRGAVPPARSRHYPLMASFKGPGPVLGSAAKVCLVSVRSQRLCTGRGSVEPSLVRI
jgi:hypothetical protein